MDTKAIQPDWTGTATYPDAFVSAGAGTYTFSANYPGDSYFAAASASAVVVVHTGNTTPTMTMVCSPTDATVAPATCGVQLPAGSTGYVVFTNGSFLSFAPINASGQAIISTEFVGQPHGTYTVSAYHGGDTTYTASTATATVVVNGGTPTSESLASQVSLSCTPSTVLAPQTATCTAQVPSGAQGTVTFSYDQVSTTIPVDGIGYARAYNLLLGASAGSHAVTASYSGDIAYAASSANTSVTVVQSGTNPGTVTSNIPPTIAMGCNSPINPTGSSACVAWVSPGATGYITFYSTSTGRTIAVPVDASGYASAPNQVGNVAAGVYSVFATYGGDQTYAGGWTFVGVTVANSGKTTSSLNLSCTPASVVSSGTLTCTAQLPAGATGTVSIGLDGTSLGTAAIDSQGKATLSATITASAGAHLITAGYGGDSNYTGADDSFQIAVTTAGGGGTTIYSYSITDANNNPGYDPDGNVTNFGDTVMGQWHAGYDHLNRMLSASVSTGTYAGLGLSWNIDSFGNRLTQTATGHIPPQTTPGLSFNNAPNNHADQLVYDGAGNVTNDGSNQYLYDAENRICAVSSAGILTGYLYDAEGRREAKGSLTSFSCDLTVNGFAVTEGYLLDQGGEQLVTLDGAGNWKRTNVFAGGMVLGTYDAGSDGFHYAFSDWLGTKRAQYSLTQGIEETCSSLPYGDSLNCSGSDATNHHFTGKERDSESLLDYFGARYYGSGVGRFMSPDKSGYQNTQDPQSLNLYTYVHNQPLSHTDPTGNFDCDQKTRVCQDAMAAALQIKLASFDIHNSNMFQLQQVSDALGSFGDNNGVTITSGDLGAPNANGEYVPAQTTHNGPGQSTITFNNNSHLQPQPADAFAATLAHEGTHVVQNNVADSFHYTSGLEAFRYSLMPAGKSSYSDYFHTELPAFTNQGSMEQYLNFKGQMYDPTLKGDAERLHMQQEAERWANREATSECAQNGCN